MGLAIPKTINSIGNLVSFTSLTNIFFLFSKNDCCRFSINTEVLQNISSTKSSKLTGEQKPFYSLYCVPLQVF